MAKKSVLLNPTAQSGDILVSLLSTVKTDKIPTTNHNVDELIVDLDVSGMGFRHDQLFTGENSNLKTIQVKKYHRSNNSLELCGNGSFYGTQHSFTVVSDDDRIRFIDKLDDVFRNYRLALYSSEGFIYSDTKEFATIALLVALTINADSVTEDDARFLLTLNNMQLQSFASNLLRNIRSRAGYFGIESFQELFNLMNRSVYIGV